MRVCECVCVGLSVSMCLRVRGCVSVTVICSFSLGLCTDCPTFGLSGTHVGVQL